MSDPSIEQPPPGDVPVQFIVTAEAEVIPGPDPAEENTQ